MDLETASLVAKVRSPSLIKLKINSSNQNFPDSAASPAFETDDTFDKENYIPRDYIINSANIPAFPNANVVELPSDGFDGRSEYLSCGLEPYCSDSEEADIIDSDLNADYPHLPLDNEDLDDGDNLVAATLNYQNLVSSSSGNCGDSSSDFISPESILEANSELVDPQDKEDYTALDAYLNITHEIEPHFIVGSYADNDKLTEADENHIDSTVNMGIENSWNEDFAVPSTSAFPLPLPAPPDNSSFNDFSGCNNFEGVEHDSYASDLEALFSSNEAEVDVVDTTAEAGVCGLRNLGNTCFMSTGIQCLAATESLVQFFVSKLNVQELDENSLTTQFTELLQRMWNGQYSVVNPVKFKQALGAYHPQFKDCSQHDCQEFLALLLDALHQQLISLPKDIIDMDSFDLKENMEISMDFQRSLNKDLVSECNSTASTEIVDESMLRDSDNGNNNNNNNNNENRNQEEADSTLTSVVDMIETPADVADLDTCGVQQYSPAMNNNHEGVDDVCNSDLVTSTSDEPAIPATKLNNIRDIFKEAKTSNVNVVSAAEMETNNDICFDSEKFPKKERRRNIADANYYDGMYRQVDSLNNKDAASWVNNDSSIDNLDLKRIKVNHLHKEKNCLLDIQNNTVNEKMEKNELIEKERQLKVLNSNVNIEKEDNRMETEEECNLFETEEAEMRTIEDEDCASRSLDDEPLCAEDVEAEKLWERHLMDNRSVVFSSFQGQFRNTVVCSACNFRSITYEPFMYLSVPLPHAIEKQLCVTFISASPAPPVKYLITMTKQDEVSKIKHHLLKLIPDKLTHSIVVGEVLDYHIAKILDDNYQVRYVDDVNRSIYAFEQFLVSPRSSGDCGSSRDNASTRNDIDKDAVNSSVKSVGCLICLEEKESGIKRHKDCECFLCDGCIQSYEQHSGDSKIKCPVCRNELTPSEDLVPVEQADMKPSTRMLNVPLVYRIDKIGDGNNNKKSVKLFGHPALLKLPNQLSGSELYDAVSLVNPYPRPFKLLLVDGQGRHCSRCMYNQHCKGCVVPHDGNVCLRSDDTLAVTFADDVEEVNEIHHSSMALQRSQKTLSLYDCVQAFSQSEILDEGNPWYCPQCKKNQCATKTLSVWRFPNYLIVYLKRFVFHDCTSIKLEDKVMFPLHDFSFNKKKESSYDLYACVCHTGGVSVGHYIAYTQHPITNEWHCFNDENVSKQKPQEEEYCNAYILFYKKKNIG